MLKSVRNLKRTPKLNLAREDSSARLFRVWNLQKDAFGRKIVGRITTEFGGIPVVQHLRER